MKKLLLLLGIILAFLAIIPLGISAYLYSRTMGFLERAVVTPAVVVAIDEKTTDDTFYYPVYRYQGPDNEYHRVLSGTGTTSYDHEIGDTVSLLVDPEDTKRWKKDTFTSLWLLPTILAGIGVLPLLLGVALIIGAILVPHGIMSSNRTYSNQPPTHTDNAEAADFEKRKWATLAHVSALLILFGIPFGNAVGPFLVYMLKRDVGPFVEKNSREALNFQLSMTIYGIVAAVLCLVVIGFLILPILFILDIVYIVRAAIASNKGKEFQYPLTIRFF